MTTTRDRRIEAGRVVSESHSTGPRKVVYSIYQLLDTYFKPPGDSTGTGTGRRNESDSVIHTYTVSHHSLETRPRSTTTVTYQAEHDPSEDVSVSGGDSITLWD